MEEKPIYDFHRLKEFLTRKGYRVKKAEPWRKIDSEEVSLREGKLEFTNEGIFLIDDDGIKRQVFLYKRKYHLLQYGKPRYHVCKCSTIDEFLNGNDIPEYRRANTESVKVLNWDNHNQEEEISQLPLCKNCAAILYQYKNLDSSQFSELLHNKATEEEKINREETEVDINGYTKDWQMISSEFRKQHNYTCEKCGVQVSPFETEFMHVHHKNKKKTDNRPSNLQCLCIKCHSDIDATHIHNFSTKSQRLLIKLFLEKYGK